MYETAKLNVSERNFKEVNPRNDPDSQLKKNPPNKKEESKVAEQPDPKTNFRQVEQKNLRRFDWEREGTLNVL